VASIAPRGAGTEEEREREMGGGRPGILGWIAGRLDGLLHQFDKQANRVTAVLCMRAGVSVAEYWRRRSPGNIRQIICASVTVFHAYSLSAVNALEH